MEASWLHNSGRKKLIVFCNGWGMDGRPFRAVKSVEYDVYMLYDYRQLNDLPEIENVAGKYQQVHLVSWSMGVWVGQKLFADTYHRLHRTLAINGTLCPIDDCFGIPAKVYDATLADFNEATRLKFYKRMCRNNTNLRLFLADQPQRPLKEQGEELVALKNMIDCLPVESSIYKEIIISDNDFIVPTANQLNYWQGRSITKVAGFHFPFNLWPSWDRLLAYSDSIARG